jgi:tellurite resistance protein TehA-like permease
MSAATRPANEPLPLPRPGFWLSLGITALLVVFQSIVGVVAVVLLMVASMLATGHEPGDAQIAMVLLPVGVMTMVVIGVAAAARWSICRHSAERCSKTLPVCR